MKILCIIPARAGSKGLPNKNVANFQGRPLIHWPILYVLESGIDLDLLVYTDGKEIADAAEELGEFTPVSRCQSLSLDTTTTEVTLRRALEQMEIYHNVKYDCVLFLTCTEIFRDLDWLNQGLQKMLDNHFKNHLKS